MKYRKQPVVIEAVQYKEYGKLVKGMCNSQSCYTSGNREPHVHTIHNNQIVNLEVGDYIIPEPDGKHFYPCKPDIFAKTYEPVEGETFISLKQAFLSGFDNLDYNEVEVEVTVPDCPRTERIINRYENFKGKKAYYDKAYNDNLELKSFPQIKIINYEFR